MKKLPNQFQRDFVHTKNDEAFFSTKIFDFSLAFLGRRDVGGGRRRTTRTSSLFRLYQNMFSRYKNAKREI